MNIAFGENPLLVGQFKQHALNTAEVSLEHFSYLQEFKNAHVYPVMIVSYEMFVRYCEIIKQSQFDILICDEGHRLKNSNIKTASVKKCLSIYLFGFHSIS